MVQKLILIFIIQRWFWHRQKTWRCWSIFFNFGKKYFGQNPVKIIKNTCLSKKSLLELNLMCTIQWGCWNYFILEILFFSKFESKIQYCQLKLKFGIQTISNMPNSIFMLLCYRLLVLYLFGKIWFKNSTLSLEPGIW